MSVLEKLKVAKFVDREIPDVGVVRIRQLKTREMLELQSETDAMQGLKKLLVACVYEGESQAFPTIADVDEIPWAVAKALSDAALDVNRLDLADAKKNGATPPSSP